MKEVFFTPGPTQLYPGVERFIADAVTGGVGSISHRSEEYRRIHEHTVSSLRSLLALPDEFAVAFLGSATEAMERIVQGCAARRSFHFVNGAFSKRFRTIAAAWGLDAGGVVAPDGEGFRAETVEVPPDAELICVTHNETSTGVVFAQDDLKHLRGRHPEAILAVDVVSSVPAVPFDSRLADCAFFSVQKGFGLPSGLGVLIFNRRCIEKARALGAAARYTGSFHALPELARRGADHQTPETPNVLAIHLLGRVAESMLARGAAQVHDETHRKASQLYAFFDAHPDLEPLVADTRVRSDTIIAVSSRLAAGRLHDRCREAGFRIGSGYGSHSRDQIRIANFPAHGEEDVNRLLSCF